MVDLMIRAAVESGQRRSMIAAVYGIIAFLDVPLVYLSVRLMPDIHPTSVTMAPEMKLTLALCFIPFLMLAAGLVFHSFRKNQQIRQRQQLLHTPPQPGQAPAVR